MICYFGRVRRRKSIPIRKSFKRFVCMTSFMHVTNAKEVCIMIVISVRSIKLGGVKIAARWLAVVGCVLLKKPMSRSHEACVMPAVDGDGVVMMNKFRSFCLHFASYIYQ